MCNSTTVDLWGVEPSQPPAIRDSATSRRAAESAAPRARTLRAQVLDLLRDPLTDDQGAERLGVSPNTYRPRRVELVRRGDVVRVATGKSTAGNPAAIWQARPQVTKGSTGERGIDPAIWVAAIDRRPPWMSKQAHQRLIAEALDAAGGDVRAALEQVARDLEVLR